MQGRKSHYSVDFAIFAKTALMLTDMQQFGNLAYVRDVLRLAAGMTFSSSTSYPSSCTSLPGSNSFSFRMGTRPKISERGADGRRFQVHPCSKTGHGITMDVLILAPAV
jgi:hypothetical protein